MSELDYRRDAASRIERVGNHKIFNISQVKISLISGPGGKKIRDFSIIWHISFN